MAISNRLLDEDAIYLKFMQKQASIHKPEAFFPKPTGQEAFLATIRKPRSI